MALLQNLNFSNKLPIWYRERILWASPTERSDARPSDIYSWKTVLARLQIGMPIGSYDLWTLQQPLILHRLIRQRPEFTGTRVQTWYGILIFLLCLIPAPLAWDNVPRTNIKFVDCYPTRGVRCISKISTCLNEMVLFVLTHLSSTYTANLGPLLLLT